MNIPAFIRAGDSVSWYDDQTTDNLNRTISSPSWTLLYAIRGAAVLDLTATDADGRWLTIMSKVQSALLVPAGVFYWQAIATKGTDAVTLGSGQIRIDANLLAQSADEENRSQAKQDLDAVQKAMRTMIAGGAVAEYSIAGRSLRKIPMADLIMLESKLKVQVQREVKAERMANGLGNPNNVLVRFK